MRDMVCILVTFALMIFPIRASNTNFLQSEEVYLEIESDLNPEQRAQLLDFIRSAVFKRMLQPPYRDVLAQIPNAVWVDIHKFQEHFVKLLDKQMLTDWDKVQYQIVRESLMAASRAQISEIDRDRVKLLASGPLPAIFTDIEFRSLVYQMFAKNILLPWIKGLADYEELKQEPFLKDLMTSVPFEQDSGEIRSQKVMEAVQAQSEEILQKARRLRDLKWFEIVTSSEFIEIFQEQGSLGSVFYELILNTKQTPLLRFAGNTDALELALHGAIRSGKDWVNSQMGRHVAVSEEFQKSSAVEYLFSWKYAYEVNQLLKAGILNSVLHNMPVLKILNSSELTQKFQVVQQRIIDTREKRLLQKKRQDLKTLQKDECLKNMDLLMRARSGYNRKYRQGIDLSSREGQIKMRGFLSKGFPACPVQGDYRSSQREWVYCTVHGPAQIPDNHE